MTDLRDNSSGPVESTDDLRPPANRLEAVLFLAREPMNSRKLASLAALDDGTQARTLVGRLNQHYDQIGRAFHIRQVAGGFQLRTRPSFSRWLKKLNYTPKTVRLSGPAMETLAVVAYRQPVLKADVEAIRGVSCGEMLRQLLDRGLVKISGRSPELGNPFLYGTTKRFLEVFGLANLDTLPRNEHLKGVGLPEWSRSQSVAAQEQQNIDSENRPDSDADPLDENETSPQNLQLEQTDASDVGTD